MAKDIIPLVTGDFGNYNLNDDEDITILYHNVSPVQTGAPREYALSVRPALGPLVQTASIDDASRGRGIADFKGYDLMLINDDTWFYSGGNTEIFSTTAFDKEAIAKFTLYSQAGADRLVLVNAGDISTLGTQDGSVWFMTDTTTAPTEVVDADMPGNNGNSLCRGGVSLDGYFFVGDILGNIVSCDLDDLTSWTSTSLVVAEREADTGVYIGRQKDHVFFMGTRSIEFFYNAANAAPASPLTRRQDLYHTVGCYHPNSVLELGDATYFIGKAQSGEAGLFRLSNFSLDIIARNPILDKVIKALKYAEPDITGATDLEQGVYLAAFNSARNGQFLVLTTPDSGTFTLHLETELWARWYLGGTPDNNGGITDWTSPRVFPLTASLNRSGSNTNQPNRFMLLNGVVSLEGGAEKNLSSSAYSNKSFVVSTESASPRDVKFKTDGTKMFMNGQGAGSGPAKTVYEYDLSTAFDVSTATANGNIFTFGLELGASSPRQLHFKPDGTVMFHLGSGQSGIFMYDMSTAWDISTCVFDAKTTIPQAEDVTINAFDLKEDGTKLYTSGQGTGAKVIRQYTLSTPWDVTTAVYDGASFDGDTSAVVVSGNTMFFNTSGTRLIFFQGAGAGLNTHKEFSMSPAWDLTTLTFVSDFSTAPESNDSEGGWATDDLSTWYICSDANPNSIYQYTTAELSLDDPDYIAYTKPWDLDTNERKRINNIRILQYPDTSTGAGVSNLGIDWIDLENLTSTGVAPSAFTGDINIDIASATARLYRAGMCRQRIYKITFAGTQSQIVKGLEVDYTSQRG